MRTRALALLAVLLSVTAPLRAASAQGGSAADRAAVLATVQKVFDAMRTRDTALLRSVFDTSARLVGVRAPRGGGAPAVRGMMPAQFGGAVAGAPAGDVWNERIFDPQVKIDEDVAQVWAYYTFHRNKEFSHCGIDAFMLLKVGGEWKITQLADSNRKTGCTHTEPPTD